jgi:hypothetical protein
MLVAKGYRAAFRLAGKKRVVAAPASAAMLQDPSGRDWSRCSLLFSTFTRKGGATSYRPAVEYFGYDPKEGVVTLPPKALSEWNFVGEVDYIRYDRPGTKYKGKYDHHFKGSGWFGFQKSFPRLYRRNRIYRLELGSGCVVNWRGLVVP